MGTNAIQIDDIHQNKTEQMQPEEFDQLFELSPLSRDTTCGYGWLKGGCLQM